MSEITSTIGSLAAPEWLRPISPSGRIILDALLRRGGLRQADLTTLLDLSQPSVARLIGAFRAEGVVQLFESAPSGRGNPSVNVELNSDFASAIGISLSGDAIAVTLLDLSGKVRATRAAPMRSMSRDKAIKKIVSLKNEVIDGAGIDPARVVGAGVGVSGFFVDAPLRFNPPEQLSDWADRDVAAELASALGLSVIGENDGTAAAIAEGLLGVGRTCANFAYCHLTNGFGGGLVIDGKPVRGALGNAGDFGGVLWMLDEGYPNLELLRTHVADAGVAYDTVEAMVRRIEPDSPGVGSWIAVAERPIGKLAFFLGHILAPEKVVIGGRLPKAIAMQLADQIELPRTPDRHGAPFPLPKIVSSEVEGDAVAIGAAAMVLQRLFFT